MEQIIRGRNLDIIDILILSAALGIDCFIASFSQGLIFKEHRVENSLNLASTMGLFQGLMPIIGYIAAHKIYDFLIPHSHQIVFGIFFILGMHFIIDAYKQQKEFEVQCIGIKCLIGLGIATSIDALISGTTIRLTSSNLLLTCFMIGITSFLMSESGFWLGNFIKHIPKRYLQLLGGGLLLILAFKSLV